LVNFRMEPYREIPILKITGDSSQTAADLVAVEKKIRISVNGTHLLSLYCSPTMVREFVAGIVHNEGIIAGEWCAERMTIGYGDEIDVDIAASGTVRGGERIVTSGCGGGVSFSRGEMERVTDGVRYAAETIRKIFKEFQHRSDAYKLTGGAHSAALTDGEKILSFAEDIGRHNAVDKVIGYCLLENISFEGKMILASGRLSSEIVNKCAVSRVPVLVSRAAPTSLAVDLAESAGITLVGFVRGERMNVYTVKERITL
jgi:FdhD protein